MCKLLGECLICGSKIYDIGRGYYKTNNGYLCSEKCFYLDYYNRLYEEYKAGKVMVTDTGRIYSIEEEDRSVGGCKGFDGMKFVFRLSDGTLLVSTNVWYNGTIEECIKSCGSKIASKFKVNCEVVK